MTRADIAAALAAAARDLEDIEPDIECIDPTLAFQIRGQVQLLQQTAQHIKENAVSPMTAILRGQTQHLRHPNRTAGENQ